MDRSTEIYLDNAATTRPFDCVRNIVDRTMDTDWGNPSSLHRMGFKAEQHVKKAKETVALSLKTDPSNIVYTSGGTESNNMALIGAALANRRTGNHIITTTIEHPSVYQTLQFLEECGFRVTYAPVNRNGHVDMETLLDSICGDTVLVSVMHVNNEIGAVADLESISAAIKHKKPSLLFHTDAVQSYGKYRIYPKRMGIDLLSASGHKIHGPKGVGFLYIGDKVKVKPIIFGGGQQKGIRSGTENVPGIAGLAVAINEIYKDHTLKMNRLYEIKKAFISRLEKMENVSIHGIDGIEPEQTAPHLLSVGFDSVRSEVLLHALEDRGIYVSAGSACASNHPGISGTLKATGVRPELLEATLRFSFSTFTTMEEIEKTADVLEELVPMLRRFTRR